MMHTVMKKLFSIILLSVVALTARAHSPLDYLLQGEAMEHASVGVYIMDIDSREVVLSHNAHKAFVPASVVKLITAASVLQCYDDTTRWSTAAFLSGNVVDSVLHGDIVVRGSLDPSLGYEKAMAGCDDFVTSVAAGVQQAGIKRVSGSVIVDASRCDMGGWGEWMAEDLGLSYGSPCYGVNYRGNSFDLLLATDRQGSAPRILGTTVDMPMLHIGNHLTVGEKDSSAVYSLPYATECLLMGKLPAMRDTITIACAMPDPPLVLAHELSATLERSGVCVDGEALTDRTLKERNIDLPQVDGLLYNRYSDPLQRMLREMLHDSNNLYAEAMLRYVSLAHDSVARTAPALAYERAILGGMGLDTLSLHLADGSGLSRKNRVTPHFMATFLAQAYRTMGDSYRALLPRAGKEGTVRSLFRRNPLPGELRLKSGSMSGVMCYAGYYSYKGRQYAIVLMSNHHSCKASEMRSRYEKLLRAIPALAQ